MKDPKTERVEATYIKGRQNEQNVIDFVNHDEYRFFIFDKNSKVFITGLEMDSIQYKEFEANNNFI